MLKLGDKVIVVEDDRSKYESGNYVWSEQSERNDCVSHPFIVTQKRPSSKYSGESLYYLGAIDGYTYPSRLMGAYHVFTSKLTPPRERGYYWYESSLRKQCNDGIECAAQECMEGCPYKEKTC